MVKSIVFVVPLVGLALLMSLGERTEDSACSGSLALEKARQLVEDRPEVVDMSARDFRWVGGCRFAMSGYADVEAGNGPSRSDFELIVALDPQTRRWQQVSLSMSR